ncbi:MAG: SCP2 sterol-binding domain-containing protein [Myxococcota bacterium]
MAVPAFPEAPVAPRELLEEWIPAAFAVVGLPPGAEDLDVKLGIRLEGEGGGEWVFHLDRGSVHVLAGSREEAAFSYVQSVEDWRGALWEGRGGAVGEGAARFFQPGSASSAEPTAAAQLGAAPSPAALAELAKLSGLIRMVVGGEGEAGWSVAFKIGPGPIPETPTTMVTLSEADAAALGTGELDPMTAFMSGRMRVEGDMTLMLQVQAVQMQAAAASGDEST